MIPPDDDHTGISFAGELRRKALHLLALLLPLTVLWLGRTISLWILIPFTSVMIMADIGRDRWAWLNSFIKEVFGPMMRTHELPLPGSGIVINGATWTFISVTILTVFFPLHVVLISFSMAMIGDAAAAIIGRRYGTHSWGRAGATIEGSTAYFVAAVITALFATGIMAAWLSGAGIQDVDPLIFAALIAAGLAAAITEALPLPGNDNVNAPLVAAAVIYAIVESLPLAGLLARLQS
jgi:dolichol kinase